MKALAEFFFPCETRTPNPPASKISRVLLLYFRAIRSASLLTCSPNACASFLAVFDNGPGVFFQPPSSSGSSSASRVDSLPFPFPSRRRRRTEVVESSETSSSSSDSVSLTGRPASRLFCRLVCSFLWDSLKLLPEVPDSSGSEAMSEARVGGQSEHKQHTSQAYRQSSTCRCCWCEYPTCRYYGLQSLYPVMLFSCRHQQHRAKITTSSPFSLSSESSESAPPFSSS